MINSKELVLLIAIAINILLIFVALYLTNVLVEKGELSKRNASAFRFFSFLIPMPIFVFLLIKNKFNPID